MKNPYITQCLLDHSNESLSTKCALDIKHGIFLSSVVKWKDVDNECFFRNLQLPILCLCTCIRTIKLKFIALVFTYQQKYLS